ncbi:FitA-like ribbon-helix-helix domain-containing protein [Haloferula sp. A504]|uniref:FitA-like ribbon-helix-helix domain-containing protein n=1 Tax=Haloferula sp. A504 TaxID=3373601 RepID=UPI0031C1D7E9|nr:hypothetical protein [Verrucomicrobiaceae bacterium E54]
MSAITLKNVPEDLVAGLKRRAAESHRSLSGEILFRLRKSLEGGDTGAKEGRLRDESTGQADAWEKLAGSWVSDLSVEEEIEALYSARSAGRDADLSW